MCWRASAYFGLNQVALLGLQVPNSVEGEPNLIPGFEIRFRRKCSFLVTWLLALTVY